MLDTELLLYMGVVSMGSYLLSFQFIYIRTTDIWAICSRNDFIDIFC
jgi:hypothetical protein